MSQISYLPSYITEQLLNSPAGSYPARVAEIHRTYCVLWTSMGSKELATGLLPGDRKVAVGDWLLLSEDGSRALALLERNTLVARKAWGTTADIQLIAANIDTLFVVSSCNQEFNESRIERYLALAADATIPAVLLLTKADQCATPETYLEKGAQLQAGLRVLAINAHDANINEQLAEWCGPGQSIALIGSSGVGKSTITNTLCNSQQATMPIREEDGKGRHTTIARSMHRLVAGGVIIDTPGMRELQLSDCDDGIEDTFDDIIQLISQCRFRNCTHSKDPGCAVQAAIAADELSTRRWESYNKLKAEQEALKLSVSRKRDKGKTIAKEVAAAKAFKKTKRQH